MTIKLGDVETTALIPVAIKASESLRKNPRDRVTMLPGSVLDDAWCGEVKAAAEKAGSKLLFLAEGFFMYLTLEEIGKLLAVLKNNFPNGTLIAEQNNPIMVKNQKYHDTVKNTNAVFKSGTWRGQEIADLCDGIENIKSEE